MAGDNRHAKWHDELDIFSLIKNGIILEGNIYDSYIYPQCGDYQGMELSLNQYLTVFFKERGYDSVVIYNHLEGFTTVKNIVADDGLERFAKLVDGKIKEKGHMIPARLEPNGAPQMIMEAMTQTGIPIRERKSVVIVMNMASRYVNSPDSMSDGMLQCYTILQRAIIDSTEVKTEDRRLKNLLVFIVDKQNDLPAWLYLNTPQIKDISIEYPTAQERQIFLSENLKSFFSPEVYQDDAQCFSGKEKERQQILDRFVARTEGFTNSELAQLRKLSRNRKIRMKDLCSVIDLYTYGIQENPWDAEDLIRRLRDGRRRISARVKGQDEAIDKTLDVIRRSVTGLSRIRNTNGMSPKGVLFFAGPTGTGKTETAKALAELVFGDESACIRFDMSEYRQDNSDQRLLGAPPGYVGYEAGGQLTNAVRRNPFSILLFDEIEKASPTILDKFLQILDDGRLTDGQGNTVYFTDCVIIFTSNKGIYEEDASGRKRPIVQPGTAHEIVQKKVEEAVRDFFTSNLGKPEILNRIGENIVVFDYISQPAATMILDSRIERIEKTLMEEKGITIHIMDSAKKVLQSAIFSSLEFGGRGVNNKLESMLINPLARHIFEGDLQNGGSYEIVNIKSEQKPIDIEWRTV